MKPSSKTVYYARSNQVFAFTVHETPKCWVPSNDSNIFSHSRFSKGQPIPWSDTPEKAAERSMARIQERYNKLEKELADVAAQLGDAILLSVSVKQPGFKIHDRTDDSGQQLNALKSADELQAKILSTP